MANKVDFKAETTSTDKVYRVEGGKKIFTMVKEPILPEAIK